MEQEENVYERTQKTEMDAAAQEGKDNSTVLGKFKDVDALARAYGSLEAEFTRRSQRLKELEKKVENFERKKVENSGAEKLRKNFEARKAEEKLFDEFVALTDKEMRLNAAQSKPTDETPMEESLIQAEAKESIERKEMEGSEKGALREISSVEESEKGISSEEVYAKAIGDESVRLRIIGEYLSSLGKSSAPITASGGGVMTAPPVKAKNIGDAGNMALRYFKTSASDSGL